MKPIVQSSLVLFSILSSVVIALSIWLMNAPDDVWSRRWLLIIIPLVSGIAGVIRWRQHWQDVALGIGMTYFMAPLIAARIESCFLPIDGAVPCFARVDQVRIIADQLGHPIYYPGLIVLHVVGVGITWWYVNHQGGSNASTGPTAA